MLWTVAVVLLVLWALGLVTSYTMGGFIHFLLVIAIVVVLINVIQGRKVTVAALDCFSAAGSLTKGDEMSGIKILALVLIVAGLLGVMYGKFSYTKETHDAKLGPINLSVKEKETVNVPAWAGVAVIAAGAALLLVPMKK